MIRHIFRVNLSVLTIYFYYYSYLDWKTKQYATIISDQIHTYIFSINITILLKNRTKI